MNKTEAVQSAPPDGLEGGGKETVSVGLESALKRCHPGANGK